MVKFHLLEHKVHHSFIHIPDSHFDKSELTSDFSYAGNINLNDSDANELANAVQVHFLLKSEDIKNKTKMSLDVFSYASSDSPYAFYLFGPESNNSSQNEPDVYDDSITKIGSIDVSVNEIIFEQDAIWSVPVHMLVDSDSDYTKFPFYLSSHSSNDSINQYDFESEDSLNVPIEIDGIVVDEVSANCFIKKVAFANVTPNKDYAQKTMRTIHHFLPNHFKGYVRRVNFSKIELNNPNKLKFYITQNK